MKILHVLYESEGDYFGIGGVGIRAYEIYRYLKDRHDITLLCKKYPGAKDGMIRGLKHVYVGTESRSLTKTLLSYAFESVRYVIKEGETFDVIIEEFSPAIPVFLNFYKRRPVVLQIQGYTGKKYFGKYNPLYAAVLYAFERLRPSLYRKAVIVSDVTRERYSLHGSPRSIMMIPNGISKELLDCTPEESDYVLFIGRIDIHHKGLDILLEACREFYPAFPGIRLAVAGDGRDREKFEEELMKLPADIRKKIELHGWVSGHEKTEVLRKALFAVFPSRYEVQPISVLEALACGKAAVVSDIPEFFFVTQSGAGVPFKSGDPASLAHSMKSLAGSEELGEMGRRGREWVKDFTWDRIAEQYEKFLLGVTEQQ
jgi:glycosyltransferase involved in cell wall biosynthesis